MHERPRLRAETLALVAVALCCALPAVAVLGAGAIASTWGAALRLWPITVAGVGLVGLGAVALVRRIRGGGQRRIDRAGAPR
jgi:hypothetical protein